MYDIFYILKNGSIDLRLDQLKLRFPLIKTVSYDTDISESIFKAKQKSTTKFFWLIDPDYIIDEEFQFNYIVPDWDSVYVHVWKNTSEIFSGVYLIPKSYHITFNEATHLFFVNKKEIDVISCKSVPYNLLNLKINDNIYKCITEFQKNCNTSMFWVVSADCKILKDLTYVVPTYDKGYIHQWTAINNDHLRLNLIPRNYTISKRESENLFFIDKKIMNEEMCKEEYDIIFISYNEPNADKNWDNLLYRFPRAKRLHGIKGIHQAHIEAASLAKTSMFWVVDGDAQILEDFNLDYVVDPWDKDSVFVWKSKNPINNLIYGYGGVKLLPKMLTLDLDTSTVDMTTSISDKFKPIDMVSNITVFNTDPFNTWKSAFRECVKLSSKTIEGQIDQETIERLEIWCKKGINELYGEYSIKGSIAGKKFGLKYSDNITMLSKINDWEWLTSEFNKL
jgi:hypothetical protein